MSLAILGEIGDAQLDRLGRVGDLDGSAIHSDLAAIPAVGAEDETRQLGPTGADESGDAEDLPAPQLEGNVLHGATAREVPDFQDDRLFGGVRRHVGRFFEDGAPDHHRDDVVDRDGLRLDRVDVLTVAHDGDPVGDLAQLLEPVGDVDDALALLAQRADDAKEFSDLGVGERGGRLVHDEDGGVQRQRLGDLDHLLLRDLQVHDLGGGIQPESQLLDELGGLAHLRLVIDREAEAATWFTAQVDVLGHGEVRGQARAPGGSC